MLLAGLAAAVFFLATSLSSLSLEKEEEEEEELPLLLFEPEEEPEEPEEPEELEDSARPYACPGLGLVGGFASLLDSAALG